jgi:hypothetical protein
VKEGRKKPKNSRKIVGDSNSKALDFEVKGVEVGASPILFRIH